MQIYYLLASVSAVALAGCSSGISEEKTAIALSESEILRKSGNALIEKGDLREAVGVFDKLIDMDPQNPLAYNGKAVAFDYSGNHLAAQDIYQTALSLSPDSLIIKNNLAMSLILNRQTNQAVILLESLLAIKTENVSASKIVRHNLALAYGLLGQNDKANELNLHDLTEEQARENIRFYKSYIAKNSSGTKSGGSSMETVIPSGDDNIGFIKTPPLKLTIRSHHSKSDALRNNSNTIENNKSDSSANIWEKSAVYNYPK